jgi:hypothetical protein
MRRPGLSGTPPAEPGPRGLLGIGKRLSRRVVAGHRPFEGSAPTGSTIRFQTSGARAIDDPSPVVTCLDPHRDRIERSPTEFPVLAVGDPNGASPRSQIWTHDRKLACEAFGPFERALSVFEDHAALTFELFVDDEIKIKVGHANRLQINPCANLTSRSRFPDRNWSCSHMIVFVCCTSAAQGSARRNHSSSSLTNDTSPRNAPVLQTKGTTCSHLGKEARGACWLNLPKANTQSPCQQQAAIANVTVVCSSIRYWNHGVLQ